MSVVRVLLFALAAWLAVGVARAEDLTLDASVGAPIIEVEINEATLRLRVDARLPDIMVINPDAARRLRLRRLPLSTAAVGLDGESVLRGSVARPNVRFSNGRERRLLAGLFGVEAAEDADGVIGPGALPWEVITLRLRQGPRAAQAHAIALRDPDHWEFREDLAGLETTTTFDLDRAETVFSRRAAQRLVGAGALTPQGGVRPLPFVMGLSISAQRVAPVADFRIRGFTPAPALAHTDQPLRIPDDADAIIVVAASENDQPPPVHLGRAAIAHCSDIVVTRENRTLTLYCD